MTGSRGSCENMNNLNKLEYYLESQSYIKLWLESEEDETDYSGYLISANTEIVVLKNIEDWHEDGVIVIPMRYISKIERESAEIAAEKILIREKVSITNSFDWLNIKTLEKLILSVQKNRNNIAIECENHAAIGKIISVDKEVVELTGFDEAAEWIDEPIEIPLGEILLLKFGDEYSDVLRKYTKKR